MSDERESDDSEELPASLIIPLDPPVEFKGGKYEQLTLREPNLAEVRKAETRLRNQSNVEALRAYQVALIALVAGVPEPMLDLLPIRIVEKGWRYLEFFLGGGQATGKR